MVLVSPDCGHLVFQGPTYLVNLVTMQAAGAALAAGIGWTDSSSTVILAAGSMFILWLGERITDKGVGNGISFIIISWYYSPSAAVFLFRNFVSSNE